MLEAPSLGLYVDDSDITVKSFVAIIGKPALVRAAKLSLMRLRIKELRKERGMRQEDLAHEAGISRSYLSELETGAKIANMRRVSQIATALECSVSDLMPEDAREQRIYRIIIALDGLPEDDWEAIERHALALKAAHNQDDAA